MPVLQSGNQTTILTATAAGAGQWVPIHPAIRNITFQITHTGSSVGTSVASTVFIEVSNDAVNPLNTKPGRMIFGSTGSLDKSPASDGFTMDAHYAYVRANVNSISTGTITVVASPTVSSGSS